MKNKIKILLLLLLITTLFSTAYAEDTSKIKNLSFPNDVSKQGVFGTYNYFLYVDDTWSFKENPYLELIYSHSDISDYKKSSITVYVNDTPVQSILLDYTQSDRVTKRIMLPSKYLNTGFNTIRIAIYNKLTDDPCGDDTNPANWLVLHKESHIHMNYALKKDSLGLVNYPYPYLIKDANAPINSVIVLPNQPNEKEVETAMLIAADFGKRERFTDLKPIVKQWSELTLEDKKNNLIYISEFQKMPTEIKSIRTGSIGENAITEHPSPFNPEKRILIISSSSKMDLRNALRILSNDDKLFQISGNIQSFGMSEKEDPPVIPQNKSASFEALGYDNQIFRGRFAQEASYVLSIPKDKIIGPNAFVKLNFKYSKTIDFERSSVIVSINDQPITDKPLTLAKADGDSLTVAIPSSFKNVEALNLKITFTLLDERYDCTTAYDGHLWAVLQNDSSIELPFNDLNQMSFEHYPYPLVKSGQFSNSLVVIPDLPQEPFLTSLSKVYAHLGHSLDYINNSNLIMSHDFDSMHQNKNMLIIGTLKDNKALEAINKHLYIHYRDELTLEPNGKFNLLMPFNQEAFVAQAISNPWNASYGVLVFTGTQKDQISHLASYLGTFEFSRRLQGDLVLINPYGNAKTYQIAAKAALTNQDDTLINSTVDVDALLRTLNNKRNYPFYLFFAFAITSIAVSLSITLYRKKRNG